MKKKGVQVTLVLPAERALGVTTNETLAAYLQRMEKAAREQVKRHGK